MDNTNKTNKYRIRLLEFVGVTCIGLTFSTTSVFLEVERENNFDWTLEGFRDHFQIVDGLPTMIVTDKNLALMNAVKTMFFVSHNLLC